MKHSHPRPCREERADQPEGASGAGARLSVEAPQIHRASDLLLGGCSGVLVTGTQVDGLARWGRSIAAALRSRTDVLVEIYMPATIDSLVDRFNSAMSRLSVKAARSGSIATGPIRVLLVPDSRALDSPEGLLLIRLVSDFPAAGVRLLVLADESAVDINRTIREMVGRRLGLVTIGDGTPEAVAGVGESEARDANEWGTRSTAKPWGRTMRGGAGPVTVPSERTGPMRLRERRPSSVPALVGEQGRSSAAVQLRPDDKGAPTRRLVTWLAAIASVSLLCALVMVLLTRDRSPGGAAPAKALAVSGVSSVPVRTVRN